jgi:hypothetical protein
MRTVLSFVAIAALLICGLPTGAAAGKKGDNPRCADEPHHRSRQQRTAIKADATIVGNLSIPHEGPHPGIRKVERAGHRFRLDHLDTLSVVVEWKNVAGPETQRVEVFTPTGNLYQSFSAELNENVMTTLIPVSGSWIEKYKMTGDWCVLVYVDSQADPITHESFTLRLPHREH